jgi:mono/diheme cytochrome c family protein
VAFFLLDPHPKMPNFPLSRSEAADLAAYIGTLHK